MGKLGGEPHIILIGKSNVSHAGLQRVRQQHPEAGGRSEISFAVPEKSDSGVLARERFNESYCVIRGSIVPDQEGPVRVGLPADTIDLIGDELVAIETAEHDQKLGLAPLGAAAPFSSRVHRPTCRATAPSMGRHGTAVFRETWRPASNAKSSCRARRGSRSGSSM